MNTSNIARFRLSKRRTFEAAHQLPKHDGKCARLHGHSWTVTVTVEANSLHDTGPKTGMVCDFGDLSGPLDKLIDERLDHHFLNESVPIATPTSEALARWIFEQLEPEYSLLVRGAVRLLAVTIGETCTSEATYAVEHYPAREDRGE